MAKARDSGPRGLSTISGTAPGDAAASRQDKITSKTKTFCCVCVCVCVCACEVAAQPPDRVRSVSHLHQVAGFERITMVRLGLSCRWFWLCVQNLDAAGKQASLLADSAPLDPGC